MNTEDRGRIFTFGGNLRSLKTKFINKGRNMMRCISIIFITIEIFRSKFNYLRDNKREQ